MPATETRSIPASALRLKAGPVRLLAAQGESDSKRRRFSLLARTIEPIPDWWWGALVHDFAGMQVGERIYVDYCHDPEEVLGFGDTFTVDANGLRIEGELTPFRPEDRANEVQHKADLGVPYQASIDFRGPTEFEWLPEGAYTQVNGRRVDGPAYIARKWTLRGVAICPLGWDTHTEAQLAAADHESPVTLFSQADSMPAPTAAPASTAAAPAATAAAPAPATGALAQGAAPHDPGSPAAGTGGTAATPATTSAPASVAPSEPLKQLQQFVADFGAKNGPQWFAEGKTHSEALQLHCAALTAQLKTATETQTQLQQKLSATQLGETTPLSGGAAPAATTAPADNYQLAAAAIAKRMPGAK